MATQLKSGDNVTYDTDVVGWVDAQVAALLARRADLLDWDNLAEEIRDVGKSESSALESAIGIVLLHLLKWDHQPERRSRSWFVSIAEHRDRARRRLRKNPSLRPALPELIDDAYASARRSAALEMDIPTKTLAIECPYDWDDAMTRVIEWDGETA